MADEFVVFAVGPDPVPAAVPLPPALGPVFELAAGLALHTF